MGDLLAWHQITYIEGAQAEARAARARGSWVSGSRVRSNSLTLANSRLNSLRGRMRSAEDLLSKNSASTLHGIVSGREVRAEYVTQGSERRGAYWRVYVDGQLHSHFRSEAGVQNYVAVALNQTDLPKFAFNVADPRSIRWAREQSSRLVTEILPETRKAVQQTISDGISQGIPPRKNANRIRSEVGMRTDQVQMVRNLGDELDSARPGTVVTRFPPRKGVRKTAGFKAKVPDRNKIGEANYQAWRTKQLDRYREMQHRYRARTIARTETGRSAAAGQLGMWKQGAASGAIPSTIKRKWITTRDGRERPEHFDHHGEVVGINEEWPWGYEVQTQPNCRCGQGLVDTEAAVEAAPATELSTGDPVYDQEFVQELIRVGGDEPVKLKVPGKRIEMYRGARWDSDSFGSLWWSNEEHHAAGFGEVKQATLLLDDVVVVDARKWEPLIDTDGFEADEIIRDLARGDIGNAGIADAAAVVNWESDSDGESINVTFYLNSDYAKFELDGEVREAITDLEQELREQFGIDA